MDPAKCKLTFGGANLIAKELKGRFKEASGYMKDIVRCCKIMCTWQMR